MSTEFAEDNVLWSAAWMDCGAAASHMTAAIVINGKRYQLKGGAAPDPLPGASGAPGGMAERAFSFDLSEAGCAATLRFRFDPIAGNAFVMATVKNTSAKPLTLGDVELVNDARVSLGAPARGARAFIGLTHPEMVPVLGVEGAVGLTAVEAEAKGIKGKSQPIDRGADGMITVADPQSGAAFTMGFITGGTTRPLVTIRHGEGTGEILMKGIARFNGMILDPGASVCTDQLVLSGGADPLKAMEDYGDLLAKSLPAPRRTPPPIGWCSWYAIRLPISHEFTMANAHVVAERFQALGMDLMLLDHGWQVGDICGDWDVDTKDYPRGLEGLAEDLEKMGLKLGIWIAPTEIAQTSRVFKEHPGWVLRDENGAPRSTWQWFWEPKPLQYQIDATQKGAYDYIAQTFRTLTKAGAVYYKIDFIAGCSGENLYPEDAHNVRGWTQLKRAMEAVREGAGESAYVRYCQTNPLLSCGMAEGVYSTNDTLDAGASTWPVLEGVFRMSSAQFWVGRLYVHESCDMSVRAQGGTEECRLRAMMLAMSGSSIMFSDDMTKLPEERIVLMQQCMPGFAQAARPVNLFKSPMPDVWHMKQSAAGIEFDLVGLFNFSDEAREMNVNFADIGLGADEKILCREFWTGQSLGERTEVVKIQVPGKSARLLSLWKPESRPQFVGTDLHLSQGGAELKDIAWDEQKGVLSGRLRRAKGIRGRFFIRVPQGWEVAEASVPVSALADGICAAEAAFEDAELEWRVAFRKR